MLQQLVNLHVLHRGIRGDLAHQHAGFHPVKLARDADHVGTGGHAPQVLHFQHAAAAGRLGGGIQGAAQCGPIGKLAAVLAVFDDEPVVPIGGLQAAELDPLGSRRGGERRQDECHHGRDRTRTQAVKGGVGHVWYPDAGL